MPNTVREAREKIEMPQFRLAIAMGRSTTWLWLVESGARQPSPTDKARLAEILGVDEATLFPPW